MTILQNQINGLTKAETQLLDTIKKELARIEGLTIHQLADLAGVSTATVSRLAKKMGYQNFSTLKLALSKEKYKEFYVEDLLHQSSISELTLRLAQAQTHSLQQTVDLLDLDKIEEAVEYLVKAPTVYLFGVGSSGTVCSDLYYKLNRIGKHCVYVQDTHVQMANIVSAQKNDLVIGISYSGETKEVILPVTFAQKQRIPTIAITGVGSSKLAQIGDFVLRVPSNEQEIRVGAIDSRNNSLFLTDLLYLALIQRMDAHLLERLDQTHQLTKQLK